MKYAGWVKWKLTNSNRYDVHQVGAVKPNSNRYDVHQVGAVNPNSNRYDLHQVGAVKTKRTGVMYTR